MRKVLHSGVEGLGKHTELVISGQGVHGGQEGGQRRGKSKKEEKTNMRKLLIATMECSVKTSQGSCLQTFVNITNHSIAHYY